ncbi:carbonic anhydrase [Clostridia bacterium]|nr:carbonic anhydrase [Clostridia bacterium]
MTTAEIKYADFDRADAGAALERLKAGNANYASNKANSANTTDTARIPLADGQSPYAVIVSCSDSRVAPEYIFDAGLGEVFVIRTAGNVVADFELGSVEYALEHLHTPLVVVMGHSGCGAVAAAVSDKPAEGYIAFIVDEIKPAVNQNDSAAEDFVSKSEDSNIEQSVLKIESNLSELLEHTGARVVGAKYDTAKGAVAFWDSEDTTATVTKIANIFLFICKLPYIPLVYYY